MPEPVRPSALQLEDGQRLYLKVEGLESRAFQKTRAILNLFPGTTPVVLVAADSGKRYGAKCAPETGMLEELRYILGSKNVVIK